MMGYSFFVGVHKSHGDESNAAEEPANGLSMLGAAGATAEFTEREKAIMMERREQELKLMVCKERDSYSIVDSSIGSHNRYTRISREWGSEGDLGDGCARLGPARTRFQKCEGGCPSVSVYRDVEVIGE